MSRCAGVGFLPLRLLRRSWPTPMEDHFDRLLTPEKALAFEFHERMSKGGRKKLQEISVFTESACA